MNISGSKSMSCSISGIRIKRAMIETHTHIHRYEAKNHCLHFEFGIFQDRLSKMRCKRFMLIFSIFFFIVMRFSGANNQSNTVNAQQWVIQHVRNDHEMAKLILFFPLSLVLRVNVWICAWLFFIVSGFATVVCMLSSYQLISSHQCAAVAAHTHTLDYAAWIPCIFNMLI